MTIPSKGNAIVPAGTTEDVPLGITGFSKGAPVLGEVSVSGGPALQVNGTPNDDQALLNLTAGSNVIITDVGSGEIVFDVSPPVRGFSQTPNINPVNASGIWSLYYVNGASAWNASSDVNIPGIFLMNSTGGVFTLTLPAANSPSASSGGFYLFKMVAGSADITVAAAGSDKIDGAGTLVFSAQYAFAVLCSDGVGNWLIFGISATGVAKV